MYIAHSPLHVLQDLEHREKQYDGRERLDVYASDDDAEPALSNVLTFVATSKNVHWLGPASMESVAQQIAAATGPSGPNYEYLERLAEALWKVSNSLLILCFPRKPQGHCSSHAETADLWPILCLVCVPDLWQALEAQLQVAAPSITHPCLGSNTALLCKACMALACCCLFF